MLVDRAYLLAYERGQAGKRRAVFQRAQLPWLGVDVRLVTGYDAQELQPWHQECVFANSHPANNATHLQQPMYVSQVLKTPPVNAAAEEEEEEEEEEAAILRVQQQARVARATLPQHLLSSEFSKFVRVV